MLGEGLPLVPGGLCLWFWWVATAHLLQNTPFITHLPERTWDQTARHEVTSYPCGHTDRCQKHYLAPDFVYGRWKCDVPNFNMKNVVTFTLMKSYCCRCSQVKQTNVTLKQEIELLSFISKALVLSYHRWSVRQVHHREFDDFKVKLTSVNIWNQNKLNPHDSKLFFEFTLQLWLNFFVI